MKKVALLFLLAPLFVKGQFFNQEFDLINKSNEKIARTFLNKCQSSNFIELLINKIKNKKTRIETVAYYQFDEKISEYDSTKSIFDYLILSNEKPIDDFIAFKTKNGNEYIVNCDDKIYNENGVYSSFDGMKKLELKDTVSLTINNSWVWNKVLRKESPEFIFAVKGFVNTIWYLKNGKIFLINLKNLKTYYPDDYINLYCSYQKIRSFNNNSSICD